jgi:hypothetical protein
LFSWFLVTIGFVTFETLRDTLRVPPFAGRHLLVLFVPRFVGNVYAGKISSTSK